ncbi:lantibiotic dehydratase [Kitasatospora sp. NPDC004799]|uniref:lantibiotic dehydratase n=1 Tax=Kitasatospora sp. NPDC004799 TaxID=3154460 RepID=UPI0033A2C195
MALVRAVAHPELPSPVWPDLTTADCNQVPGQVEWLRALWADENLAEALMLASPALACQVTQLIRAEAPVPREVRRAALSTARYLLRASGRPTPFGYFAGVQAAVFGPRAELRWGLDHHTAVAPSAAWLAHLVRRLERVPALLARLDVVANDAAHVCGDRLVIPHQALDRPGGDTSPMEVSLRYTRPIAFALACARHPVPFGALAGKLAALALGDRELRHRAESALATTLLDPGALAATTDLSACHGYAGLAHIAHRAAADALPRNAARLRSAAVLLLDTAHPPRTDPSEQAYRLLASTGPGLLEGAAGTALALLAPATGTAPVTHWDACLLTA